MDKEAEKAMNKAYKKAGHNAYFSNGFAAGIEYAESKKPGLTLRTKLSTKEQHSILNALFGFYFINVDEDGGEWWVLHDEYGNEFYGENSNDKFDFTTLEGIFAYATNRAKEQGFEDAQYTMRKALGL